MERELVYKIIDREREYQEANYNPNQVLSSGVTREIRDKDVTAHLTMLDTYLRKAQDSWTNLKKGDNTESLRNVAKIAAIAVRALERAGGSERLLEVGLRD